MLFAGGRIVSQNCRADQDDYVCAVEYEFPARIDHLEVECTLFAVTVPNHVHVLHAVAGGESDEAVFDSTLTRTVACLALEILLLPGAGKRWLVVFALGLFQVSGGLSGGRGGGAGGDFRRTRLDGAAPGRSSPSPGRRRLLCAAGLSIFAAQVICRASNIMSDFTPLFKSYAGRIRS